MHDLKFAIRQLLKRPGFSLVVVLTLAIGIGAVTAVFSLLDGVVLRPLPVQRPKELAVLSIEGFFPGSSMGIHAMSYPMYRELRDECDAFKSLFSRFRFVANLGSSGDTERVIAEVVSGNYFETLGVHAALGRTFTTEDDQTPGAHPVAVLSYDYWMSSLGGDPDVLGRTVHVNGQPLTVIGVSARGFDGVELDFDPAIRVPMTMTESLVPKMPWVNLRDPLSRWTQVMGRLRPGVSLTQAQAALQPLYQAQLADLAGPDGFDFLNADMNRRFRESKLNALPGQTGISFLRNDWTAPLIALMAMVSLLMVLTCVNIANLHIARSAQRQGELAVRMAVGAGRWHVVRQLFTEMFLLALIGGVAGLLLATSVAKLMIPVMASPEGPANIAVAINWRIFGFAFLVFAAAALASGLMPALLCTRLDPARALHGASSTRITGGHLRRTLVAAQVSLSLVLLIGSGLFMCSLHQLNRIEPGMKLDSVVVFGVDPALNGYPRDRVEDFYRRLKERLEILPGVDSVALSLMRTLGGEQWSTGLNINGYEPPPGEAPLVSINAISPDYVRALGMRLRRGREFTAADDADAPGVVIVNESLAERYFRTTDVVGRHFNMQNPNGENDVEIVGVVQDAKYDQIKGTTPPQVFLPYSQFFTVMGMHAYVRGDLPASSLFAAIRQVVREIDPSVPVHAMRTMEQQRNISLMRERCLAIVASSLALVGTLLAALGLYGLLSAGVTRRTRELGLRLALGASRSNVVALVLREAGLLWGIGSFVGILAALGLGRLVANQLYGVQPHDPLMILAATLMFAAVTILATTLPAVRATRIDPAKALRTE